MVSVVSSMADGLLALDDVTKQFDTVTAVDSISLDIQQGQTTAIIGPNGAGKTTLFNLITGRISLTAGSISFRGERIDGLPPHEILHRGLARSFQISQYFPTLTTLENVRLAAQSKYTGFSLQDFLSHYDDLEQPYDEAYAVLDQLGLSDVADQKASNLSHGDQRHLELAISLATDPDILFMDEPTAGMGPKETKVTEEVISDISDDITVVIIEHDMEMVLDLSDRVGVMNRGSLLTIDTPSAVQADEQVQEAYLAGGH